MTEISEDELAGLSEFSLLSENAEQAGVSGPLPEAERVESGWGESKISALRWGRLPHGSSSCTAAGRTRTPGTPSSSASGEPALAVDLPGHGHSAWREDGDYSPQHNAETLRRSCANTPRPPNSSSACRWAG